MTPLPPAPGAIVIRPRLTGFRAFAARSWLVVRHRWLGRRYGRLVVETLSGLPGGVGTLSLVVLPDVFNPVLFRGGALLAETIAGPEFGPDRFTSVLDLGCGSGVVAVAAAKRGTRVVASDINPSAVACAAANAHLNGVADRVVARQGDLFAAVEGERFDLIVFNPPFFRGQPRNALDCAWRGEDVFERFAARVAHHLAPRGEAWVLLSTDGAGAELLNLLRRSGFTVGVVVERRWANEIMTVFRVGRQEPVERSD